MGRPEKGQTVGPLNWVSEGDLGERDISEFIPKPLHAPRNGKLAQNLSLYVGLKFLSRT